MDDSQIIELYFSRDEAAIRETNVKYGKLCLHIARNILDNPEDAEECVQDTFLAVWNAIPPAHPDNFSAFVCKIARNLSLKKLEYQSAAKRNADICISLTELESILPAPNMETGDLSRLISAFLKTEKESARKIFLRRYWFFDSVSEIARQCACSESKVKSMLSRTRKKLAAYLQKEGISV